MGSFFSRLVSKLRGTRDVRLLMLGLDNAGKTTILYKLKFNQTVTTIPTAGFNVECLVHKNVKFHVWDVGGQDKIRPLWRHYHTGTKALIFVVDCQDRDRIHEARIELHRILRARELADAILLIFANKQDLTQSMGEIEVRERLQLDKFPDRVWSVQASCATTGEGLMEGLNWLADNIKAPGTNGTRTAQERKSEISKVKSGGGSPNSGKENDGDTFKVISEDGGSTDPKSKAINNI